MIRRQYAPVVALVLVGMYLVVGSAQNNNVVTRTRSNQIADIQAKTPGEFYVALESLSDAASWRPNSPADCVAGGLLAGFRRWLKKDSVSATIVVDVTGLPSGDVAVPLFVVSRIEKGPDGKPQCLSKVVTGPLTPYFKASAQTAFSFKATPEMSKSSDIAVVRNLLGAVDSFMTLTGGSGALLSKLSSNPVKDVARQIDQEIGNSWTGSGDVSDSITMDLAVFPSDGNWANFNDVVTFNLPQILASKGGENFSAGQLPAASLRVKITDSLLAVGGRYPSSATGILTASLSKGQNKPDTIQRLMKEGLPNATDDNLVQASDARQMGTICRALTEFLSGALTSRDSLVALYAVLAHYSSYDSNSAIRTSVCLSAQDQDSLKAINPAFSFQPDTRETMDRRDAQLKDIYRPIAKAFSGGSKTAILAVTPDNGQSLRFAVSDSDEMPARTDGKKWAATGPDAVDRVIELRKAGGDFMKIGCYQARSANSLTSVAGVLALANKVFGVSLETNSMGKLTGIRLGTIDTMRDLLLNSNTSWPSPDCDLLD
jgi:hypothetical protein